jgi:cobalt-zinc-cadmium efflux system outer membrane protein
MSKDTPRIGRLACLVAISLSGCHGARTDLLTTGALSSAGGHVCAAPTIAATRPGDDAVNREQQRVAADQAATETQSAIVPAAVELPESSGLPLQSDAQDCLDAIETSESAIQLVSDAISKPQNSGITVEQLEQLALENNPTIRQLSASASKAGGIQTQSGLYPNPIIAYSGVQLADRSTDQQGVLVEQEIVLGDKLQLNRQVHQQDVQVRLWEVEAQRQRVLTDIRTLFYSALATQRQIELIDEFRNVAARGAEVAQMRRDALDASLPEVLQAQIQLKEVELRRQQTQIELTALWNKLSATTGVHHLEPSSLSGTLEQPLTEYDWDIFYEELCSRSPELAAARADVQRARTLLCRQQRQPIPNLNLQLVAGRDNATDSGFLNVQAAAAVPVFNRNEGNIRAAYADYCRATHEVRRVELSLRSRLADVSREFDAAAAGVGIYREEILPRAQQTLDLSEQAYEVGEFGFLQVLLARQTFFESNLRYVTALSELAQAKAVVNGLLLAGGLSPVSDFSGDDGLRGQALDGR